MWTVLYSGVKSLIMGWFDVVKSKQQAEAAYRAQLITGEQDWDIEAMKASRYSWKDELITIIWYSPLIIGWLERKDLLDGGSEFYLRDAGEWIAFVDNLPFWWQLGAFGIMASSFGLRWYFKQQDFKKVVLKTTGG